ncbi:hypothetical protein DFW101_1446 [Solidesulfovibrio carbinoliphilus subsp. oakridgensis]|uniref:Uncharacterized protein n=1 Tax=Solidesulfovibrio carbinoliphilus subsp. oakridgensis TaxID=694327 RepID=G7Q8W8_9BACT|nr:hypothetical protein [Solidesulfovibrio carbinoliphilus]EHJ47454.1 hypothetical protein DFW101_1446 [Solidesulfovibrio carbinoliphilus subsp. oakridgensis]
MTLAELKNRLPARTLAVLVAGAVIAVGFVAVFIIPDTREAEALRHQIGQLRANLELRRQLLPVAQSLKDAQAGLPSVGPVGGGERLPLAEVGRLAGIMDGLAAPLGLRVNRVSPDPSSVTRNGLVAVRLGLVGPADAFREFLLALGRYGPLVKVESLTTAVDRDGREYTVKCWLAVR